MSAMKVEKNGQNSCTGNSRHISIRYFLVKDRLDKTEFRLDYCLTGNMIADFLPSHYKVHFSTNSEQ